ncbi:hypothetical protein CFC21_093149 [Triticum aestivum]|uniref:Uncharacterized protein n=2 Tax=Triticum aestivum TaxID=4565 RepID=A0A9R1LK90_WHEAT|nr:uncharacterized protein LOC119323456 [Triticum dicoccoides]KAF7090391.1 hypothetical protein CFC21_093149 [Triticum aestivum]
MGMGGRGVVGDRWSQRVLWMCAIGSAVSLYFVAVERQAQNRARAVSEGFKGLDGGGGGGSRGGEDV